MSKTLELKLKDLELDYSLSGRSRKEINDNAKALAPMLKASGGWDETQPGAVFKRDGKHHLARGFTRYHACELESFKTGHFIEIPDKPAKLRTEAIRSNAGRPISQWMQGEIYAKMRDGSDPQKLKKGEVALEPMGVQQIADEVGYSFQHVSKCIAIFESPEAISALIEEGKISANAVYAAQKLAKDTKGGKVNEGKQLQIVKAAIKEAGEKCATEKHVTAVKDQFAAPEKKLTAAERKKPKKGVLSEGAQEFADKYNAENPKPETQPSATVDPAEVSQSAMDLGTSEGTQEAKPKISKKDHDALVKDLGALVLQAFDAALEGPITLEIADSQQIAEWLIDKGVTIAGTPSPL